MRTVTMILLILAALLFLLAALNTPTRINLVALGLLCWVLAILIPIAQQ